MSPNTFTVCGVTLLLITNREINNDSCNSAGSVWDVTSSLEHYLCRAATFNIRDADKTSRYGRRVRFAAQKFCLAVTATVAPQSVRLPLLT